MMGTSGTMGTMNLQTAGFWCEKETWCGEERERIKAQPLAGRAKAGHPTTGAVHQSVG